MLVGQLALKIIVPFWIVAVVVLAGMIFTTTSELYALYAFFALWGFFITYTGDRAGLVGVYRDFVAFFKSFTKVKY
jgi:hypothetical protein